MNCPGCDTPIPAGGARCPMCGATMLQDAPSAEPSLKLGSKPEVASTPDYKTCKYCAMSVPKAAQICPYCRKQIGFKGVGTALFVVFVAFLTFKALSSLSTHTPPNTNLQTVQTATLDYEHDLVERCKDWIYCRNQILKLTGEGDLKGAAHSRVAMNTFYNDMLKIFTEKEITETIDKIEAQK